MYHRIAGKILSSNSTHTIGLSLTKLEALCGDVTSPPASSSQVQRCNVVGDESVRDAIVMDIVSGGKVSGDTGSKG